MEIGNSNYEFNAGERHQIYTPIKLSTYLHVIHIWDRYMNVEWRSHFLGKLEIFLIKRQTKEIIYFSASSDTCPLKPTYLSVEVFNAIKICLTGAPSWLSPLSV